jgi:cytochrome b6-f complex iron-sulfur subunit
MATTATSAMPAGAAGALARPGAAGESRRNFLAFAGWGTIGLIALQAAVAFLLFFWPRKLGVFGGKVSAGNANDYQTGDVKYFVDGKFYLVRLGPNDAGVTTDAGGFVALYQRCPHVGCTVPWRPEFEWPYEGQNVKGLFRCPCHGSTYLKTGQIIFGPAPRPMDLMKINLEGGRLVVDTGNIKKRPLHDPSQVVKA